MEDEPPRKKKKSSRKFDGIGSSHYPEFDWDELDGDVHDSLRRLIKSAENREVPCQGLKFRYNDVCLVRMDSLENSYLKKLAAECEESGWDDDVNYNHTLYHDYLAKIIKYHLTRMSTRR